MVAVEYQHSSNLSEVLGSLNLSLLLSTYQAGKLVSIGSHASKPTFSFHSFDQVMGVAVGRGRIAVGTRREIHFLRAAHDVAATVPPKGFYDGCFLTRASRTTGRIHGHDLAFGSDGLWIVNTLFSCLCTLDGDFNFFPRWKPPFVTQLIDQDRCHLNGLALEDGMPRYVTVLGITDEPEGWRRNKKSGGAILDVVSGGVVSCGLSMPHSPRLYAGKLWVLNSGCGELATVDVKTGRLQVVASFPGYTRGLSFHGKYAFVGLSRIRETNVFGGLPIGEYADKLQCGLGIVDIETGYTVASLSFQTGVDELFAVETVPGVTNPRYIGPSIIDGEEDEIWIVPTVGSHVGARKVDASNEDYVWADEQDSRGILSESEQSKPDLQSLVQLSDDAHAAGDFALAIDRLQKAIKLSPDSAELLNRIGNLYQEVGEQDAAILSYQKAVEADPHYAPAHQNLGVLWIAHNQPIRALSHFEAAQKSVPNPMNLVLAAKALPIVYESIEQLEYWRDRYNKCVKALAIEEVKIDTTNAMADTSFSLAYQGENDRELMETLGQIYRGIDCVKKGHRRRPKGKKIRVGFVSAYFKNHTIGRLNLGRIGGLSRDQFEVIVLSLNQSSDEMSLAFESSSDQYVALPRQVARARSEISQLELDILVFADIGMDAVTQSLCYSRMAPVQAVTWGHPDTSGSPAIDYFVSSSLAETDEAQSHYTERLECLDTLGVYYTRPILKGTKRGKEFFGLRTSSHTYICPQTAFKFHPAFDVALRGILEADRDAELVVLEGRLTAWTDTLKRRWERSLPDGLRRVKFLRSQSHPDFLQLLACADVVLDPFPFCGGNTSYEAFAVGSPIVTFPGRFLRGRLTHAMFKRMGIESMSANSVNDYIQIAVELGKDLDRNRSARAAINAQSDLLFEQRIDNSVWETLLHKWVEGSK